MNKEMKSGMKLLKRITALLLSLLLLVSGLAFASDNDIQSGDSIEAASSTACSECGETDGHAQNCSQYIAPACSECGEADGHAPTCSQYQQTVVPEAYANGARSAAEEPKCDCGSDSENINDHDGTCARATYVLMLCMDKSAEQIYSDWEFCDQALRTDILNWLQAEAPDVYQDLLELIAAASGTEKETTTDDGIRLKLQGIPEEVTLKAATVSPRDYHSGAWALVGSKKIIFAIDITLSDAQGDVWQPAGGQSVIVSLDAGSLGLANGSQIAIFHDHNGTLSEPVVCTVENGTLTFTANEFSVYYGYTVDFEYDGTWYSIGGGSERYLYELFAQLGISRSADEVSSISFSDDTLFSASERVIDGYTGKTGWHIQTLAPFTTEEVMTVVFQNGNTLSINVYDAAYNTLTNDLSLNDGDSINATTISGAAALTISGTVTVDGTITIPAGASLTITGSGTLKRGNGLADRIFSVTGGSLTITGSENSPITIDGGAVWNSTEVNDSTRKLLTVGSGTTEATSAAIYVDSKGQMVNSKVHLTYVTMQNLYTASGQAPAIHTTGDEGYVDAVNAEVQMEHVTVQNCATKSGMAILLFNDAQAQMTNCHILDNYSGGTYAGAIKAGGPGYFSQLTMNNCTASGNYSAGWGGVLLWAANNTASNGQQSKATITGCTFENNTARYLGGALSNEAVMEVSNTTIGNNTAMAGGGIANFPFTLTSDTDGGGNACGLTLGSGNIIEGNTATADGDFTPYSKKDDTAPDGDDATIINQITYTGGGGGIWCYMNKEKWTCTMEIGAGNTLSGNTANNVGGGVYMHNVQSAGTTLNITGAAISGNKAVNGGGVALKDASVNLTSGQITGNTASGFGGGIYVDDTTTRTGENSYSCTVSASSTAGTGYVKGNTAANGGGIYIANGSLLIDEGIVTANQAKASSSLEEMNGRETAQGVAEGVGGGIYLQRGTFTMAGANIGLHSNTADFAAADAYASGTNTTLILPDVGEMNLKDWDVLNQKPTGWYADYKNGGEKNYPQAVLTKACTGRYDYYAGDENIVKVEHGILKNNTSTYYCLTLGTTYPGYGNLHIIKTLKDSEKAPEDQTFLFEIKGKKRGFEGAEAEYSLTVALIVKAGESSAELLVADLPDGTYTVTEKTGWSWRYTQTGCKVYTDPAPENKEGTGLQTEKFTLDIHNPEWYAEFTNQLTETHWLSSDCACENWWGGSNGTVEERDAAAGQEQPEASD